VERLLEKQPDARYSGAEELVTLLAGPFDAPAAGAAAPIAATLDATVKTASTPPPLPAPTEAATVRTPPPRRDPATAEGVAPAVPPSRPARQGPSPGAVIAIAAVLGLALLGALGVAGFWLMGGDEEGAGAPAVASATDAGVDPATRGEAQASEAGSAEGSAGEPATGAGARSTAGPAGSEAGPSTAAPPDAGPAAGEPAGTAKTGSEAPARRTAGPGGASQSGSSSGSPRVEASAPARPAAPLPPPARPPVALGCSGVGDGCGALTNALHASFERAGLKLARPDRAEVQLELRVEQVGERSEQQFGTTFVVRTYAVSVMAEAPRFDELIPMPVPASISFDTRLGAEKLNEASRVIASDVTDHITRYWGQRVP
jgi:hypothetical protein